MVMNTVYKALVENARKYGSHPYLHIPSAATAHYQESEVTLSFREMLDRVELCSSVYKAAGYGECHRVALAMEHRADFFIHWFALNRLGASVVPVNDEHTYDEIAYLLDNSEVCLLVTFSEKVEKLQQSAKQADLFIPVISVENFSTLPAAQSRAESALPDEHSECALLYTSGSTGRPKGCILSNEYFLECGRWYVNLEGLCKQERGVERLITPLSLVHMNAMACSAMAMLMSGGCLIQLDRFHPKTWWQTVRNTGATIIHYLGVMPAILLNMPESENDDFKGQIKFGFGAGVNPEHHEPFERRFGFPLIEAWAMTESGTVSSIIANLEPRKVGVSCIGKQSALMEIILINERGKEVPRGQPGEALIRATGDNPRKGFFSGYYKNKFANDEIWQGGWLHTGDVLSQDEEGYFYFVDRKKNIIRRSGENIAALEVEAILAKDPVVEELAVTAVADELRGEEVMACITLRKGTKANNEVAQEIFRRSIRMLSYYKAPGYIAFVEKLPLTPSQKLSRVQIKKLASELIDKENCFDLRRFKKRK